MQCDRHVVKMTLESAQMLCMAYPEEIAPYRRTKAQYNHPCTIWSRSSKANYEWLLVHAKELSAEYTRRYGKTHKCDSIIRWCEDHKEELSFPAEELTEVVQAMPEQYQGFCPVAAYRRFYIYDKSRFAQWNKSRSAPTWYRGNTTE